MKIGLDYNDLVMRNIGLQREIVALRRYVIDNEWTPQLRKLLEHEVLQLEHRYKVEIASAFDERRQTYIIHVL